MLVWNKDKNGFEIKEQEEVYGDKTKVFKIVEGFWMSEEELISAFNKEGYEVLLVEDERIVVCGNEEEDTDFELEFELVRANKTITVKY
jgi:hypothetical protein